MRIATWNLARPSRRRAAAQAEQMKQIAADVWIFTEVNMDGRLESVPVVASQPDSTHGFDVRWTAIWSHYPIRQIELSGDPTRTACAMVSPSHGAPFIVYGTVLPWVGSAWGTFAATNGAAFRAALAAQVQDWFFLKRSFPNLPICVAGDFNQDLNERHYYGSKAGKAELRDALTAVGLQCVTAGKNDPIVNAGHITQANIDHICLTPDLARKCPLPARCWPGGREGEPKMSDHFGVYVDVAW